MSELKRATAWDKLAGSNPVKNQDLNNPYIQLSVNLIEEELTELQQAMVDTNVVEVIDAAADLLKVVSQLCFALDVDPEELLKEINDSNYTKFCYNIEDAERSVLAYESDERYIGVHWVMETVFGPSVSWRGISTRDIRAKDTYVIKGWKVGQDVNTATPKVLKGIHYKEPDLRGFIKGN